MANIKGLMTSKSNEWYTPQKLFDYLNSMYGFTLDPCATKQSAKCKKYYTIEDNGLMKDWGGHSVFVNPPYGRELGKWVEKAANESLKLGTIVVMLIPARTDTKYFHDYIFNWACEITFIKGRVKFERPDGTNNGAATFPSAIVVFDETEKPKKIDTLDLNNIK